MNSNNKKIIRNLLIYLGIPILLVVLLLLLFDRGADQTGLKYSDVLSYFEDGKVSAYSLNLGTGEMKLTVTEDSSKKESVVRYTVPLNVETCSTTTFRTTSSRITRNIRITA